MKPLARYWSAFWYESFAPKDLYVFRVLFYVLVLIYTLFFDRGNLQWLNLPSGFWSPVSILRWLDEPLTYQQGMGIEFIFSVSCLFCALGLGFRLFSIICFLSYFLIITITNSYGVALHDNLGIVIYLFIFIFSNAHIGLSLDKLLAFKKKTGEEASVWPVRLCQVMFGLHFFVAGYNKLYSSGISWFTGDTLRNYMIYAHYRDALSPLAEGLGLGLWLAQFPFVCKILAVLVLSLELFGPFIGLVKQKTAIMIVIAYALMILGFYFSVTDGFLNLFILFSCWWPLLRESSEKQSEGSFETSS